MYDDHKTKHDRLGYRMPLLHKIAIALIVAAFTLGAMHSDHYAITHGLIH